MEGKITIGVFCGSKFGHNPKYMEAAEITGSYIGSHGYNLVFGGGNSGLMGIVSQAALRNGARVTGVIPDILMHVECPKDNLTKVIQVRSMHERKKLMTELSDIFVVLPGGIGTFDEAFELLTGNWIGAYRKPLGFLDVCGYYKKLFEFLDHCNDAGFIADRCRSMIYRDTDIESLVSRLIEHKRKA